jgi:hypothetical protein
LTTENMQRPQKGEGMIKGSLRAMQRDDKLKLS